MSATVQDVMTTRVIAVRREATFKDMAAMLTRSRVSAFPVVDEDGRVIGVVSESDLLGCLAGQAGHLGHRSDLRHRRPHWDNPDHLAAADLMTSPAIVIGSTELVTQAARVMYTRRIRRLPVVGPSGRLTGIISRADVLSVYGRGDEEVRLDVLRILRDDFLVDPLSLNITVSDGIVTVAGRPETDEIGEQIVAAVRHLEGVVAVRDRLHDAGAVHPAAAAR